MRHIPFPLVSSPKAAEHDGDDDCESKAQCKAQDQFEFAAGVGILVLDGHSCGRRVFIAVKREDDVFSEGGKGEGVLGGGH